MNIPISQSLMNQVFDQACPYAIYLRYVQGIKTEPSEVMKRGHYFEYCVIGDSSSEAPQLEKLKSGGKSQAEKDIDQLAEIAKKILSYYSIDLTNALTQVKIEGNGLSGILDLVANDIQNPERKAIYDIKYTETRYDDRFNGWADIETKINAKRQAKHYIHLWHQVHGEYLPYYFLVFGKSGWCRVIKCMLTKESLDVHLAEIGTVRNMLTQWESSDWKPDNTYLKCRDCGYQDKCKHFNPLPLIEKVDV
jgi:hypothetical protein